MKGGVAAFAAAALDFVAAGGLKSGTLSFLITNDEEGPSDQRHREAARMGGGPGHPLRRLHRRRADQSATHRRHGEDRPARLAQRRYSSSGACRGTRAYPQQADNPIPVLARIVTALTEDAARPGHGRVRSDAARRHLRRCRQSSAATSFPARRGRNSTCASTISGRPRRLTARIREIVETGRRERPREPRHAALQCARVSHAAWRLHRSRQRGHPRRDGPDAGPFDDAAARPTRASSRTIAACWNSGSSARRSMRSTRMSLDDRLTRCYRASSMYFA